jgi:hypothetical protein
MAPIPPVLGWSVGFLAAAAFARLFAREWRRVNQLLERYKIEGHEQFGRREPVRKLRRDPRTGIYRPD